MKLRTLLIIIFISISIESYAHVPGCRYTPFHDDGNLSLPMIGAQLGWTVPVVPGLTVSLLAGLLTSPAVFCEDVTFGDAFDYGAVFGIETLMIRIPTAQAGYFVGGGIGYGIQWTFWNGPKWLFWDKPRSLFINKSKIDI
jgi:hypothetical protein